MMLKKIQNKLFCSIFLVNKYNTIIILHVKYEIIWEWHAANYKTSKHVYFCFDWFACHAATIFLPTRWLFFEILFMLYLFIYFTSLYFHVNDSFFLHFRSFIWLVLEILKFICVPFSMECAVIILILALWIFNELRF